MNEEYVLVLGFDSAKYFPYDTSKMKPTVKTACDNWVNVNSKTLHHSHISNVLHVLCGQRPVPRRKNTFVEYSANEDLQNIAKSAVVIVNNPVLTLDKNDVERYHTEIIACTKGYGGKTSGPVSRQNYFIKLNGKYGIIKTATMCWDRIKFQLKESAWNDFNTVCDVCLGISNIQKFTVIKIFEMLNVYSNNNKTSESLLAKFFEKHYHKYSDNNVPKISQAYLEVIVNGKSSVQFFDVSGFDGMGYYFTNYVLHSPEQAVNISGKIYLKVSRNVLDMISENGKNTATILDGGLVHIESITPLNEYNFEENTKNTQPTQLKDSYV
jgi:hypothetical protein